MVNTTKKSTPQLKTPSAKPTKKTGNFISDVMSRWEAVQKNIDIPAPIRKKLGLTKLTRGVIALFAVLIIASLITYFYGNQLILAWQKQTSASIVNGEMISRSDLNHRLTQTYGDVTVQKIIDETLVLQEGQKQKIGISQDEINQKIADIEKQIAPTKLDDALSQRHLTRSDLDRQIRIQIIVEKILGNNITTTDQDLQSYFDQNKDTLAQGVNKSVADLKLDDVRQTVMDNVKSQMISSKYQPWVDGLRSKSIIKTFL